MADRSAFLEALSKLQGSGQVNLAPLPATQQYTSPEFPSLGLSGSSMPIPASAFGATGTRAASTGGDPWWLDLLNGLQTVSGQVPNQLANWTDGKFDFYKDVMPVLNPVGSVMNNIGKGQVEAWKDGELGFKDIPGFGGLVNAGKDMKTSEDVLENLGWKDEKGKIGAHDVVSTVMDMALDPLTYLTFGGASAAKAGLQGARAAAKSAASEAGVQLGKGALKGVDNMLEEVPTEIAKAMRAKHPNADPYLLDELEQIWKQNTRTPIENAAKSARAANQNNLINVDIPFGPFIAGIGSKPKFLQTVDGKIGAQGALGLEKMLNQLDSSFGEKELADITRAHYGVAPEQMTLQMAEDFQKQIENFAKNFDGTSKSRIDVTYKDVPQPQQTMKMETGKDAYINRFMQELKNSADNAAQPPKVPTTRNEQLQYIADYMGKSVDDILEQFGDSVTRTPTPEDLLSTGKYHEWARRIVNGEDTADLFAPVTTRSIPDDILKQLVESVTDARQGSKLSPAEQAAEFAAKKGLSLDDVFEGKTVPNFKDIVERNRAAQAKGTPAPKVNVSRGKSSGKTSAVVETVQKEGLNTKRILSSLNEFVQDAGGTSKLGRTKALNVFNGRTFNSDDALVNKAAGDWRDANNKIYSELRTMEQELGAIQKSAKGLTEEEMQAIPHIIEGKFPKDFNTPITAQMQDVANQISQVLERIGAQDLEAGTIENLLQNYFPHVMKPNLERIAKYTEKYGKDAELERLGNMSSFNKFGQERKGFATLADMVDAQKGAIKAADEASAAGNQEMAAQMAEKAEILKDLFMREPIDALSERYYKSITTRAMKELQTQFQKDGLMVVKRSDKPIDAAIAGGKNMVELDAAQKSSFGIKSKDPVFIHKDVLDGMKQVEQLLTDKGADKFVKNVNSAVNAWKSVVTVTVPSHYVNNFMGNIVNATLAGVTPRRYGQAAKLLNKMRKGTLTAKEQKFIQQALDNGVLNQGFTADFTRTYRSKLDGAPNWMERGEDWINNLGYTKAMKRIGNSSDNLARLATFIHGKYTTGSTKQAAELVRKHLFNYRELTKADRYMRSIAPFWNWTKNNLPLQVEKMLTQTRYYQMYNRAKQLLEGDNSENSPDWVKEKYLTIGGKAIPIASKNPMYDLNMLDPRNTLQDVVGMVNPVIKAPFELAANKQIFSDRPIEYGKQQNEMYDLSSFLRYAASNLGGIANTAYRTGDNLAKGNEIDIIDTLQSLITGRMIDLNK